MDRERFQYIVDNQRIWREMYQKQQQEKNKNYNQKQKDYRERKRQDKIRKDKSNNFFSTC